jgi:hypothetical protein
MHPQGPYPIKGLETLKTQAPEKGFFSFGRGQDMDKNKRKGQGGDSKKKDII